MSFQWLVVGTLCVWRVTYLLTAEVGPWNVLARIRQKTREGFLGGLLDCFYCSSLWVSVPFALLLGSRWFERLLLWPTLSAGAILMERFTNGGRSIPRTAYLEDEEREAENVLRRE